MRQVLAATLVLLVVQVDHCTAADLTLSVDEQGVVTAIASFSNPLAGGASGLSSPSAGVFLLVVPFGEPQKWMIKAAPDLRVAPLSTGPGYTVLTVLAPRAHSNLTIEIGNCLELSLTQEGKSKIEFDLSYTFLSQSEKEFLPLPSSVSSWDARVLLPREHDETEVSYSPNLVERKDQRTFLALASRVASSGTGRVWIVFPDPRNRGLQEALLVVGLLIGLFSAFFHLRAIRDRKLLWLVFMFTLSLGIVTLITYYSLVLANRIDFLVWAAAPLPHVLFTLGGTVFVFVARNRQACISGLVKIDGHSAAFADVCLWKVKGSERSEVKRTDRLSEGRYTFFVWERQGDNEYLVSAQTKTTNVLESAVFAVSPGDRFEVSPPIELTRRVPQARERPREGVG